MNDQLKTIVELISLRHGVPGSKKIYDSASRLSALINTGHSEVVLTILANEPPKWLQDLILDDSYLDLNGKAVYGYFLSSLRVSKATLCLLFCYALKSNLDWKDSIPDDNNIASLRQVYVQDQDNMFPDFFEDIFPHLDPKCQILGSFNGTRILNPDEQMISFLKRYKGSIVLKKTQLYDQQIIKTIQFFSGKLSIDDIKTLVLNDIKQLISIGLFCFLPKVRKINEDAIPLLLEKFKGKLGIRNDDVEIINTSQTSQSMDDYKLLALTKSGQTSICLPKETILTFSVAQQLAKTRKRLDFRTITPTIDLKILHALETHKGTLILDGVEHLKLDEELSLSKHIGRLSLKGIREICTPELARKLVLSAQTDGQLQLTSLVCLRPEIARELSTFKGSLFFDAILVLDDDVAKELASHQGYLRFNQVRKISDYAARLLLNKKIGNISFQFLRNKIYENLTRQESVTNLLVLVFRNELLCLNHLKTIEQPEVEILIKHLGGIQLNGLENFDNQIINDLVKRYRGKSIELNRKRVKP
jgi:hypothetical protein